MALPDGASAPATMSTSLTIPSSGAARVASAIWLRRSLSVVFACAYAVSAEYTEILACRIWSVFAAVSAVLSALLARRSWSPVDWRLAVAAVSCALRSVVSPTARAAPFLTVSPALTATDLTSQVVDDPVADEVEAAVVEVPVSCWAAVPKASPYRVEAAIVPVAAMSLLMLPTTAAEVRYVVADAALVSSPPMETMIAPAPARMRTRIASSFSFMGRLGFGGSTSRLPAGGDHACGVPYVQALPRH